MTTFRRDKLRRLIEAGKVEMIGAYSFDDLHGADRVRKTMPVAIMPEDRQNVKTGVCGIRAQMGPTT